MVNGADLQATVSTKHSKIGGNNSTPHISASIILSTFINPNQPSIDFYHMPYWYLYETLADVCWCLILVCHCQPCWQTIPNIAPKYPWLSACDSIPGGTGFFLHNLLRLQRAMQNLTNMCRPTTNSDAWTMMNDTPLLWRLMVGDMAVDKPPPMTYHKYEAGWFSLLTSHFSRINLCL